MRDPLDLLQAMAKFSQQQQTGSASRPARLGKIDPAYSSGSPKVIFDGETVVSGKGYPRLSSYAPVANDRVLLIPVGTSYVIAGKVTP